MATPIPRLPAATITPVEPAVAERESEPERFARASEIADRFLDNIETVVYGKRDEIKLVLTALACGGHVLLEDVPGHGQDDARARDRGDDRGRDARRASSARPTCSRRT